MSKRQVFLLYGLDELDEFFVACGENQFPSIFIVKIDVLRSHKCNIFSDFVIMYSNFYYLCSRIPGSPPHGG